MGVVTQGDNFTVTQAELDILDALLDCSGDCEKMLGVIRKNRLASQADQGEVYIFRQALERIADECEGTAPNGEPVGISGKCHRIARAALCPKPEAQTLDFWDAADSGERERLWASLHSLMCNPVLDEIPLVMQEVVAILRGNGKVSHCECSITDAEVDAALRHGFGDRTADSVAFGAVAEGGRR